MYICCREEKKTAFLLEYIGVNGIFFFVWANEWTKNELTKMSVMKFMEQMKNDKRLIARVNANANGKNGCEKMWTNLKSYWMQFCIK